MTEKQKLKIKWAVGVLDGVSLHVDDATASLLVVVSETLEEAIETETEEN